MNYPLCDLRSDTLTRPTALMKEAMMQAALGDDVFQEDPTVLALENRLAQMFSMEAGLFCPSGTMTNQIALKAHTQPGDEIICDELSHIYLYEGGGIGSNCGCSVKLIRAPRGILNTQLLEYAVNDASDVHKPLSRLLSVENTMNRGGGGCYTLENLAELRSFCNEKSLGFHLDGARIFNALVATNTRAHQYGTLFHSISICLSKGLGAPVGSVLLGNKDFIKKARRIRKAMGGGMRQAGVLAAAGLYALDHHITRLQTDHDHAKLLAAAWEKSAHVAKIWSVETNIVLVELVPGVNAKALVEKLADKNVHCFAMSHHSLRMVTHLDTGASAIAHAVEAIGKL